ASNNSGLRLITDSMSGTFAVNWGDLFPVGSSYRVEKRAADGSFATIDVLGSLGGAGQPIYWRRPYTERATYRVVAQVENCEFTLVSSPPRTATLDVPEPDDDPFILASAPEPLSGLVLLTRNPALPPASNARWTVD